MQRERYTKLDVAKRNCATNNSGVMRREKMLAGALRLASFGIKVIPLFPMDEDYKCTCGTQCNLSGKHPLTRGGKEFLETASCDFFHLKEIWSLSPLSGVAIPTGKINNIVVFDIDPARDGLGSFYSLTDKYEAFPETLTVISGGGGFHYYFRYYGSVNSSVDKIASGIDFVAEDMFVVAPPSYHSMGNSYDFVDGKGPEDISIGNLPEWLKEIADEAGKVKKAW